MRRCRAADANRSQYDLPPSKENYIHRIGRGGRFGRKGVAINFVTTEDVKMLREIEAFYNTQVDEMRESTSFRPRAVTDRIPYSAQRRRLDLSDRFRGMGCARVVDLVLWLVELLCDYSSQLVVHSFMVTAVI
jgi:hypothetical protein